MIEFLKMGGYGAFIWSSYFITFGLVTFLYFKSAKELKALEAKQEIKSSVTKEISVVSTARQAA
jgi:heme exporter protein CcmD